MKLRNYLWCAVIIVLVVTAVESSSFLKESLLRPRRSEICFGCRAEDRPFAYPLIQYLTKAKDMFVRGFNSLVDKFKTAKLR
uniref:SFRICE_002731 n=1 Tax=Spodoptera frugiperda TaxID=7108 RepID=A0A2H1V608_SPOFR